MFCYFEWPRWFVDRESTIDEKDARKMDENGNDTNVLQEKKGQKKTHNRKKRY